MAAEEHFQNKKAHTYKSVVSDYTGQYNDLNLNQNRSYFPGRFKSLNGRSMRMNDTNEENDGYSLSNMNMDKTRLKKTFQQESWNLTNSEKRKLKVQRNSNSSSSTLSLHIAAYENTVEGANNPFDEKEYRERKRKKSVSIKNLANIASSEPQEEREIILKEAMATASKLRAEAAEDEKALGEALWKKLLQKKQDDDKAALIKSRKAQEAFNKVQQYGGIWRDVDQMNIALNSLNATKKRKAVEDQLRCHKLYLQTLESNSPLFKYSVNKVKKDTSILIRNLTSLLAIAQANEEDAADNVAEDDDDDEDD
uniref:Uncharacterized protein n=1 Tax=Panagrolaimus sp. ES5 TaxID=591445 RepID=A0AC34G390_9BILA